MPDQTSCSFRSGQVADALDGRIDVQDRYVEALDRETLSDDAPDPLPPSGDHRSRAHGYPFASQALLRFHTHDVVMLERYRSPNACSSQRSHPR